MLHQGTENWITKYIEQKVVKEENTNWEDYGRKLKREYGEKEGYYYIYDNRRIVKYKKKCFEIHRAQQN